MNTYKLSLLFALPLLSLTNVQAEKNKDTKTEVFDINGVELKMVYIPAGSYLEGAQSVNADSANYDPEAKKEESPVHKVNIDAFWMGETEVTQELWASLMGEKSAKTEGWTKSQGRGAKFPAYYISYNEAKKFVDKLNEYLLDKDQLPDSLEFVIPTEAEWEYAARGGDSTYRYSGSDSINDVAWYWGNSQSKTHQVGEKSANGFGLKDMSGNLWEWTCDIFFKYPNHEVKNPIVSGPIDDKVLRGGSWMTNEKKARITARYHSNQDFEYADYGFRLAMRRAK